MPEINPFLRDAPIFLRPAFSEILARRGALTGTLMAALGVERLLKGVLWATNPTFTLTDSSFKNAAPSLYSKEIGKIDSKSRDEIAKVPDDHVLTFRISVLRAGLFSKCVDRNRGTLLKLNQFRDLLAHCDLTKIDMTEMENFLYGSIYSLVNEFAKEGWVELASVDLGKPEELNALAIEHAPDTERRVHLRLEKHKKIYALRIAAGLVLPEVQLPKSKHGEWFNTIDCPACGKKAIVRFEVDYDVEDGYAVSAGAFVDFLQCPFCKLKIDDFEELELIGVTLDAFHEEF